MFQLFQIAMLDRSFFYWQVCYFSSKLLYDFRFWLTHQSTKRFHIHLHFFTQKVLWTQVCLILKQMIHNPSYYHLPRSLVINLHPPQGLWLHLLWAYFQISIFWFRIAWQKIFWSIYPSVLHSDFLWNFIWSKFKTIKLLSNFAR